MYTVTKRMEIAGAHRLELPYESKCSNEHGHNWIIIVHCSAQLLTDYGMVLDFAHIKRLVSDKYDHQNLNEVINLTTAPEDRYINPTAENLAYQICRDINFYLETQDESYAVCHRVDVQESEGNTAVYAMSPEHLDWLLNQIMKGKKGDAQ